MHRSLLPIAIGALLLLLAGAWTATAHPLPRPAPPAWGSDIQVNPVGTPALDIQKNISLALDPTNPNHLLASYDTIDPQLTSYSGYVWSNDAGRNWQGGLFYGAWITTSESLPQGHGSVAFDRNGTAYYAGLATSNEASGYFVLTSTVDGAWSTPVPVAVSDYSQYRDRGVLAIDQRASGPYAGSLYLGWRYFTDQARGTWLRYSRDGGRTWSGDVQVTDGVQADYSGPSLAVASDGTVYAAYARTAAQTAWLYLDRSSDGGATWGKDHLITGATATTVGALDWKEHALVLVGDQYGNGLLVGTAPMIAVAPDNPQLVYAAWNDGRWDSTFIYAQHSGQHGDIAFSRSTDGGQTWSAPQRVNDDLMANGVDQFQPALAAGPGGVLGLSWYDRRDDPQGYLYHQYVSQSTDGGQTWSANGRVSDQPSNPTAVRSSKGEGYLGEYHGLVYGPDYLLTTWLDTRAGAVQDVYADRAPFGAPTPTLTATPTPSATAPPASPTPGSCALPFADVSPGDPFAPYITWVACHGLVSGYTCGGPGEPCNPQQQPYFRPVATTTRAQLAKMVALGIGWPLQTPATPTFVDVPTTHPFYAFIETAVAQGVISGYGCGGPGEPCPGRYLRPGAAVTRGQLCKIIVGAKGWGGTPPPGPTFQDVPDSSPFYVFIEQARAHGVVNGYVCGGPGEPCDEANRPYFRPVANATRGQLSKILTTALTQP